MSWLEDAIQQFDLLTNNANTNKNGAQNRIQKNAQAVESYLGKDSNQAVKIEHLENQQTAKSTLGESSENSAESKPPRGPGFF